MNWLLLCRLLGLLGMLVGGAMAFSLPWAFPLCGEVSHFESRGFWGLVGSMVCSLASGGLLYFRGRQDASGTILRKEALAVVGLGWIYAGFLGSLPYLFSGAMRAPDVPMNVADAFFESVSGFTTTGASVLNDLDDVQLVPRSVLFWRSFTHWLGGMGIIVLFVAILGQLGAGGKALVRHEVPGPINESVRPRVRETAMVMWAIYVSLSVILTTVLVIEGMSLYDALCHCFGTLATGGFSTHTASVGHFNSLTIELTIIIFMIAAGTNFSLYYLTIQHHPTARGLRGFFSRFSPFIRDPEFRVYIGILLVSTVMITASLTVNEIYPNWMTSLRHSAFMAVSIMTTTGFGTEDFHQWTEFSKGLLLLLMFVGGCAGSTGGGIKVIRFILFQKIIRLEIERAFRPNVVRPLRIFGKPVDAELRHEVIVYFSIVLVVFVVSWMMLAAIEPDTQWQPSETENLKAEKLLDCMSAVAATLNNIGPGLGVLGPHQNYSGFSSPGKLLLTLLMLLGRLELFAILVLFLPSFWRAQ
ncbi:MAG: TrkH family potassium uptake protein [Planctomycetaceae bacterium]